ncbi:MAG TPA: ribonuclease D [Steroidobacteraceae bacterium]|nr:ribonuclease D [Steroidobacteraceae bacterium]
MSPGDTPVRDPAQLESRVGSWSAGCSLALDTEFVRERTYYPRLCLVQVAAAGDILLVDAIAIPDGGALVPLLADPARPKLLHAARQDIEAMLPVTGTPLAPVFDTQQAAALLGFPAQVGYAELARQLLGIELAKGHARTDWSRRPLSREQLAYAADDVRHLPALADALESRLAAAGRRAWLAEESAALADISLYRVEPAEAWRRLKCLERLDAPAFAAARALAEWRERRAMARDLPRGWILPDAAICELALERPRTREALTRMSALPPGTAARAADELLAAVAAPAVDGAERAAADAGRPGPEQLRLQKSLQARLGAIAADLGIQPEVLATRRELAALARGERDLPSLRGWRKAVVGERLLAAI